MNSSSSSAVKTALIARKRSAKNVIIVVLFLLLVVCFVVAPRFCGKSFLDGLTVWAVNVLPALFPFALLAPLAARALTPKKSLTLPLFGVRADGVFLLSLACGYPIGAKVISSLNVDDKTAVKLSSFCSTPSPIFVLATVGALLDNPVATAVLALSQLVGCIANGLIFRGYAETKYIVLEAPDGDKNFSEMLTDAVLSVLSVGGVIALVYMVSAVVKSLLSSDLANNIAVAFLLGLAEMTNGLTPQPRCAGVLSVTSLAVTTTMATVLCSGLLGFGGIGVMLQSMSFLSKRNVSPLAYLKTKMTQSSVCAIVSYLLCLVCGVG